MSASNFVTLFIILATQHLAASFTLPPPPPPPTSSTRDRFVLPGAISESRIVEPPLPSTLVDSMRQNESGTKIVRIDFVKPVIDIRKPLPAPPTFPAYESETQAVVKPANGDNNKIEDQPEFVIYADETLNDEPSQKPQDYDILYNDVINCPLKSYTANDRAYFGAAFRVLITYNSAECMTYCFHDTRCKSINFVPFDQSQKVGGKFACELNEFDQRDNPRLLIQRQGATYYDRIRCDNENNAEVRRTTAPSSEAELIEKYNQISEEPTFPSTVKSSSSPDYEIKLNRLTMLETIMKTFHKEPTID